MLFPDELRDIVRRINAGLAIALPGATARYVAADDDTTDDDIEIKTADGRTFPISLQIGDSYFVVNESLYSADGDLKAVRNLGHFRATQTAEAIALFIKSVSTTAPIRVRA